MGLFDGGIFINNGPSFIDKVDMLFMDVEIEGKKRGYEKAATEYEKVFKAVETEYNTTEEIINSQKEMYNKQSDVLIDKLEALECQKRILENQVGKKTKAVSEKYDIPLSQVQGSLAAGTILVSPLIFGVFNMIYQHKEQKFREAEQRGYLEAKKLYETKISELKRKLASLKNKGNSEIEELKEMIGNVLEEIAEKQMKIAELEILLKGTV